MKLSDLYWPVEFGFRYNKFTFPLTFVCGLLMIPIIYYQELNFLAWWMIIPFVLLYIPIHDKPTNVMKDEDKK